ncbi:fungal specific transcription factor domain-containing protein [Aspergillus mulundensis]|uniref:Putative Zn(II)2Cys6 transcription factor n=1 Tax=Aspergillus mulundensis TaxID=1810919 RepID=A0A3D8QAR9_9EURO|nr:putative Zn(II)2Cys6 transcription factor [Aspergillus mulundensis]RDW58574.1 putative Zn(II)2Cys6 transcription factor [Aspergillus mulundensis]
MPVAFTGHTPQHQPDLQPVAPGPYVPDPPRALPFPVAESSLCQQAVQTLDLLPGVSAQLVGSSGESDPFLLRHCKFDDYGFLNFHQVRLRNAGGVPWNEKIPVHYLVTDDALCEAASTRGARQYPSPRQELDALVPVEHGQRLLSLFLSHVWPSLPIVSTFIASEEIRSIPVHLMAALYASALPFAKFDDSLSIVYAYQPAPTSQLWRLTLDLVQEEMHRPHLSVLQAGLLYLHRPSETSQEAAVADSPFVWSFVGMMVGLAMTLGLQLECRPMGMPLWERRLRRRLWWAIYSEDKWRALLGGRPPYINEYEWDVTDIDEDDFEAAPSERFILVVKLARIADEIQSSLYSLRAAQRLSSNFAQSLQISRILLRKLQEWFSLVPLSTADGSRSPDLPSSVHFAYLLLEVFVFRALLRPMVPNKPPPRLIDESEEIPLFPDFTVDDYLAQIIGDESITGEIPATTVAADDRSMPMVLNAAENSAANILRLISRIDIAEMGSFWYSWCRIGFATVSNFMLLLLVQAPSAEHAIRAKRLVYGWQQALRSRSQGWNMVDLGLVRLNGPLGMGVGNVFYLPSHVQDVLDSVG